MDMAYPTTMVLEGSHLVLRAVVSWSALVAIHLLKTA